MSVIGSDFCLFVPRRPQVFDSSWTYGPKTCAVAEDTEPPAAEDVGSSLGLARMRSPSAVQLAVQTPPTPPPFICPEEGQLDLLNNSFLPLDRGQASFPERSQAEGLGCRMGRQQPRHFRTSQGFGPPPLAGAENCHSRGKFALVGPS